MLTLYQHPLSTFSRRVRMALLEKGLEARFIDVDIGKGEHQREPYLTLNPYGRVPTLVTEDGLTLFESTAILDYLEAEYPEPSLLPKSVVERAQVAMHIKLCDLEMARFVRELFFPRRFTKKEKWDLVEQDKAREVVRRHLGFLEQHLKDREWLVSKQWTMAELCYTPFVQFLEVIEVPPPPNVAAWRTRLDERPSAKATRLAR